MQDRAAPEQGSTAAAAPVRGRRLALNYLALTAGELVAKLLTFAAFTYLGRVLGPERYGGLELVLAIMVFFTLAVDLGLSTYGAREIAKDAGQARALLRDICRLRLLLAAGSLVLVLIVAAVLPATLEVKLLLGLYGVSLLAAPALLQWFFQGHDRMHWVALASITRQGVFATLIFLFLRPGLPLAYIGLFECASVLGVAAFCLFIVRVPGVERRELRVAGVEHSEPPAGRGDAAAGLRWAHLRESFPIGLSELAWALLWYSATVLLGLLASSDALGWFGASHRVVMALHTFVWLYFFNLLPSISRCVRMPREHLAQLLRQSLVPAAWSSLFLALVITASAGELMRLAYGRSFAAAGLPLALLVWMIPIAMLSGHYRYTLIAFGLQRLECYCTALAAVVCISLGLLLIPRYQALGAAIALLAANAVNFAAAYLCVSRYVAVVPFKAETWKPLAAGAASLLAFAALVGVNTWLAAAAALACYLILLVACERQTLWAFAVQAPAKETCVG